MLSIPLAVFIKLHEKGPVEKCLKTFFENMRVLFHVEVIKVYFTNMLLSSFVKNIVSLL